MKRFGEAIAELESMLRRARAEQSFDDAPATEFTSLARSSFVLRWPSRYWLERDPWLDELRATPAFRERIAPLLP